MKHDSKLVFKRKLIKHNYKNHFQWQIMHSFYWPNLFYTSEKPFCSRYIGAKEYFTNILSNNIVLSKPKSTLFSDSQAVLKVNRSNILLRPTSNLHFKLGNNKFVKCDQRYCKNFRVGYAECWERGGRLSKTIQLT